MEEIAWDAERRVPGSAIDKNISADMINKAISLSVAKQDQISGLLPIITGLLSGN